jgi:hypothetical protein
MASDINSGSVILTYTPDNAGTCIINNQSLVITIVDAPEVNIPQNLEVCVVDSAVFSINVQGSFSTITWSTTGDGSLMVVNDVEVTYDPGPQDIADQFVIVSVTVQSTFPQCGSTTYNIPINTTIVIVLTWKPIHQLRHYVLMQVFWTWMIYWLPEIPEIG